MDSSDAGKPRKIGKNVRRGEMIKKYIAGALIANSPLWVGLVFAPQSQSFFWGLVFMMMAMLSCGATSWMLLRYYSGSQDRRLIGLNLGMTSWVVYAVFITLFRMGQSWLDLAVITGLVLGGLMGSHYMHGAATGKNS
ncbi:MAG: hypothetical protein NWE89_02935 [Candidatus Bathyarchaeota archaeon]|nr:hypothetical protein [Candidatus Bathyarchaeota archaeon]